MKTHSVFIRADSPTPRLRGDAPKTKKHRKYTVAFSRVCQSPLSDPKAQSENRFRYAAAERGSTRSVELGSLLRKLHNGRGW
jgi:hypothetical protein